MLCELRRDIEFIAEFAHIADAYSTYGRIADLEIHWPR